MFVNNKGYKCEDCGFRIPGYVCNRHITLEEAEAIAADERPVLDGFSTNDGRMFSSIPRVVDNSVILSSNVTTCDRCQNPQMGGGKIKVMRDSFTCSARQSCHETCIFRNRIVRRNYMGHQMTCGDVVKLVEDGYLDITGYDDNGDLKFENFTLSRGNFRRSTIKPIQGLPIATRRGKDHIPKPLAAWARHTGEITY